MKLPTTGSPSLFQGRLRLLYAFIHPRCFHCHPKHFPCYCFGNLTQRYTSQHTTNIWKGKRNDHRKCLIYRGVNNFYFHLHKTPLPKLLPCAFTRLAKLINKQSRNEGVINKREIHINYHNRLLESQRCLFCLNNSNSSIRSTIHKLITFQPAYR